MGAWGWMIASYSSESTLQQAVEDTFSGERPCALCCIIDQVEETEPSQPKKQSAEKDLKLLDRRATPLALTHPSPPTLPLAGSETLSGQWSPRAPTPPPRS
ncbi:hypothetical protein [Coraliomargarita akajimensis]|uniref:Uncharacterized protein n=1 Tax=Coraliomargarita akajimensis (strain DSM 45221 / IAM 15411 / JCM 23193 / KCTC 12865 / 04OKA010-24) TaxID=583355 RepID=D5EMQ9_CORAD|nr:hypothetical protein [Coraliomargarita akajimensis]ADE55299.1 hypothetical protein Caka_2282 [Coraliomargarita akajimensis DSM 45221]